MLPEQLTQVLGAGATGILAAALIIGIAVAAGTRYRLGPHSDWVEVARAVCLPILDPVIERLVGGVGSAYAIAPEERVGIVDADIETVETWLWDAGCRRNVLSAYKQTPHGPQQGAWVYRGAAVEEQMQVDIILAETPAGRTAVYAHYEYSSGLRWLRDDPSVLVGHYNGDVYDLDRGAEVVRETLLPDVEFR